MTDSELRAKLAYETAAYEVARDVRDNARAALHWSESLRLAGQLSERRRAAARLRAARADLSWLR